MPEFSKAIECLFKILEIEKECTLADWTDKCIKEKPKKFFETVVDFLKTVKDADFDLEKLRPAVEFLAELNAKKSENPDKNKLYWLKKYFSEGFDFTEYG
jgi:hypothetical protein